MTTADRRVFLAGLAPAATGSAAAGIGTAYAIWTGVGTVGTAILGMVLFGESTAALRLACIGLIVAGIIGLKLVTPD